MKTTRRALLCKWLRGSIESGKYPGLCWKDKAKGKFVVPWQHGSSREWTLEKDGALFRDWALFKDKFHKGEIVEARKWKSNFRNALNQSKEIEECKEERKKKGEHYRIYRFLKRTKRRDVGRRKTEKKQTAREDKSCVGVKLRSTKPNKRPKKYCNKLFKLETSSKQCPADCSWNKRNTFNDIANKTKELEPRDDRKNISENSNKSKENNPPSLELISTSKEISQVDEELVQTKASSSSDCQIDMNNNGDTKAIEIISAEMSAILNNGILFDSNYGLAKYLDEIDSNDLSLTCDDAYLNTVNNAPCSAKQVFNKIPEFPYFKYLQFEPH